MHDQKMVVILRMNLHCDACCEEMKRRILRIKGLFWSRFVSTRR